MNKDFKQIFEPFYYLTTMYCARKINFKDNKLSQINKKDITTSVLANTGIAIACYFAIMQFASQFSSSILYIYLSSYLLSVIDYLTLQIVNLVQSKYNFTLFLTLRKIYTCLSLKKQLKKIKFQLLLPCTIYVCTYLGLIGFKLCLDPLWSWSRVLFTSLVFDLELKT